MKISKPILIASAFGTLVGGSVILKEYLAGGKYEEKLDAAGKVIIVTGANSGIGRSTALTLAELNAKVIMACRDGKKCEEARESIVLQTKNKHVYCRKCDLASQESIRKFVENFKKEHKRLDVLINNAGVMNCPKDMTVEGIEMQLGVNHMGHFLLTNLLLDKLIESSPSRIINLGDVVYKEAKINTQDLNSDKIYNGEEAYKQSKLAIVLFTTELAKRLKGTNVTVNTVYPGIVDTELMRHTSFAKSVFATYCVKPFTWPFIKSSRQGAQTVVYAALDQRLTHVSGKFLKFLKEEEITPVGKDDDLARWLWLTSEKWMRLEQTS